MIRYALTCDHEHEFEGWFGSSVDFDDQQGRGQIECPMCASRMVRKQIMAPAVSGTKRTVVDVLPPKAQAMMIRVPRSTLAGSARIRSTTSSKVAW